MKPHRARKRFGQNFLIDDAVVDAIVAAIAPRRDDRMVEIGPGLGALTRPLCERARAPRTSSRSTAISSRGSAREFPLAARSRSTKAMRSRSISAGSGHDLRVVGNLPYNISTPLLFHLAGHAQAIRDIHVMLQKEVVERMVAAPVRFRLRAALGDAAVPLRDGMRARGAAPPPSGPRRRWSPRSCA